MLNKAIHITVTCILQNRVKTWVLDENHSHIDFSLISREPIIYLIPESFVIEIDDLPIKLKLN
jgi:hypothetical protein